MFDMLFFPDAEAEDRSMNVFVATLFYTTLSIAFSYFLLPMTINGVNLGGIMAVMLTTFSLTYPITKYIRNRDHEELLNDWSERKIMERHAIEAETYISVFLAATLVFAAGGFVIGFGDSLDNGDYFHAQGVQLDSILPEGFITGQITGYTTAKTQFNAILLNNAGVLVISFALGLLITGGVIFLIIWNASVLGVLVGQLSQSFLHIPLQILPYLVHGTLEIAAYVFAGLAGTLFSYNLEHWFVHGTHTKHTFERVTEDCTVLLLFSVLILIVAAVVETGYPFA